MLNPVTSLQFLSYSFAESLGVGMSLEYILEQLNKSFYLKSK